MKKKLIIMILTAIILLLAAGFIFLKPNVFSVNSIDLTSVSDGTYHGESVNGVVKIGLEVQVTGNRITDIKILEHRNGLGKDAEKIVDSIINTQSLDVDVISGATYSSTTILKAVENAVDNAGK